MYKIVNSGTLCLSLCLMLGSHCIAYNNNWADVFIKRFSKSEIESNRTKNQIILSHICKRSFSQLLFSWNAFRPQKGYFTFFIKSRNAATKKWSKWHKMVDWGKNIQRSYFSRDGNTKYVYVRLEAGPKALEDAFKIKLIACHGACLSLIKGVAVCSSDFNMFRPEKISQKTVQLKSVYIKNVPKTSQRILDHPQPGRLCSPTSCSMLAAYCNKKPVDPVAFAYTAFDTGLNEYGSWPFNIAALFDICKGRWFFYTARLNGFGQLHKKLMAGVPVVVSVRGRLKGAQNEYKNGHLLIVVGWDAKRKSVICHDPAFYSDKKTLVRYTLESFLKAWERSRRLAYVAEPLSFSYIFNSKGGS